MLASHLLECLLKASAQGHLPSFSVTHPHNSNMPRDVEAVCLSLMRGITFLPSEECSRITF